jgi:hypothetical protein
VKASLALSVETEPLERVRADLAVAAFFADERPLRGDAGRADWRLLGMLSELLRAGRLRGAAGEALLVPTLGRLLAPRLLLLGLGDRKAFGASQAEAATREAVLHSVALACARVVLSAPGRPVGPLPPARSAEAVLRGAVAALRERPAALDLILLVGGEASAVCASLTLAAKRAEVPVRLRSPEGAEAAAAPTRRRRRGQSAVQDGP